MERKDNKQFPTQARPRFHPFDFYVCIFKKKKKEKEKEKAHTQTLHLAAGSCCTRL